MAAIQDFVLTFCPKMHCFTTKETKTLDACIAEVNCALRNPSTKIVFLSMDRFFLVIVSFSGCETTPIIYFYLVLAVFCLLALRVGNTTSGTSKRPRIVLARHFTLRCPRK